MREDDRAAEHGVRVGQEEHADRSGPSARRRVRWRVAAGGLVLLAGLWWLLGAEAVSEFYGARERTCP